MITKIKPTTVADHAAWAAERAQENAYDAKAEADAEIQISAGTMDMTRFCWAVRIISNIIGKNIQPATIRRVFANLPAAERFRDALDAADFNPEFPNSVFLPHGHWDIPHHTITRHLRSTRSSNDAEGWNRVPFGDLIAITITA